MLLYRDTKKMNQYIFDHLKQYLKLFPLIIYASTEILNFLFNCLGILVDVLETNLGIQIMARIRLGV